MDGDITLEKELEKELQEPNQTQSSLSTPRQRLEDARAMATTSAGCSFAEDVGGEPTPCAVVDSDFDRSPCSSLRPDEDTSMTLLKRLSHTMVENGEWDYFHEVNIESQRVVAEMDETLGSLRQWKTQRKVDSRSLGAEDLDAAPNIWPELSLLSETSPSPRLHRPSLETMAMVPLRDSSNAALQTLGDVDDAEDACGKDSQNSFGGEVAGGERDPLLVLWQEHHHRAQQAVGRLRVLLQHHPTLSAFEPSDGTVLAAAAVVGDDETKANAAKTHQHALLRARGEINASPAKSSPNISGDGSDRSSNVDRVSELRRDVDGLQMRQWIQNMRTQECNHAEGLAREACDDILRGTGSAVVERMEVELDGFASEVDTLLLRLDLESDDGEEGARNRGEDSDAVVEQHLPAEERAPVADARVGRHVVAEQHE